MAKQTSPEQRREFCVRHQTGETYQSIADSEGVSRGCVRYWCRRQRDGGDCQTRYVGRPKGALGQFDPKVRYVILRYRLEHPRWGPDRIREHLAKRPSLRGLRLPSVASIGRYLHQWDRFCREPKAPTPKRERPRQPREVHQRWQIDFKQGIELADGQQVNLCTVRDPVGAAVIGAYLFPAGPVGAKPRRVTIEQVRSALRASFAQWGTLPDEVQTDGEVVFIGQPQDLFPSRFTLWLTGLGIDHLVIRPGRPTDNAEVERCHRTVHDYAVVGREGTDMAKLQKVLDKAVHELNYELSSRAKDCGGLSPVKAHPELLEPRRPYRPEHELATFSLQAVDELLASYTWERKVGKTGQITMGKKPTRYSVGRDYARQQVMVRFDPADRHFVFYEPSAPEEEIGRRPAKELDVGDLTGLAGWPIGLGPQQLPLPLFFSEGVSC